MNFNAEISIKDFLENLNHIALEYNNNSKIKFLSPTNIQLELCNIYTEHPTMYVLFEFINKEKHNDLIRVTELIDKVKVLCPEYKDTYIDFINAKNQSIIFNSTSIKKGRDNTAIIQFHKWIPLEQEKNDYKSDEIARALIGSIFK